MLRPQFVKQRLSDIQVFERHIKTMIDLLPNDGRTINLAEWWHQFTLDASTEYLFGESVDSLFDPRVLFNCLAVDDSPCSRKPFHAFKKFKCYDLGLVRYGDFTILGILRLQ